MKILALLPAFLAAALTLPAAQQADTRPTPKQHKSVPTGQTAPVGENKPADAAGQAAPVAAATPVAAPAPKAGLTLDAYLAALAGNVPLTKDEQTDLKAYYQDDGAKLQAILNDASLSPLQQTEQIDALRDSRNARIGALLNDVGRQAQFLKLESAYRVALVELAAQGGLVPGTPPPKVPEPTATPPSQAEKSTPGIPRVDAVPGT